MIITRKHLSRRTFLRSAGGLVGFPLLRRDGAGSGGHAKRSRSHPRGCASSTSPTAWSCRAWTPATQGKDFEFTPILKPLEPFRDHTLVLSHLMDHNANALGAGGGDHARASASFLTGRTPAKPALIFTPACRPIRSPPRQLAVRRGSPRSNWVSKTSASSACATGTTAVLTPVASLRTPTTPLPPVPNPKHVFERLFGTVDAKLDPATAAQSPLPAKHSGRSGRGNPNSEIEPRARGSAQVDEYLTSIREVERGIQLAQRDGAARRPSAGPPSGIPADPTEHARLMFELLALAFQTDTTRIVTMMVGRESSIRSYDHLGLPESHHQLSHHKNDPATLAKLVKIQTYHMELFSKFVAKLKSTQDERRDPARSLHDPLRSRHRRQQPPHARKAPRSRHWKRKRQPDERAAHRLRQRHTRHKPSSGNARPRQCASGSPGRQHRTTGHLSPTPGAFYTLPRRRLSSDPLRTHRAD